MKTAIAQIAPRLLDRDATLAKVVDWIERAARDGCRLVCFGEALVPGYPVWIERTDGARFDSPIQKELHAMYIEQAVDIDAGHLDPVLDVAARHGIAVVLGIIERPTDRGGHSLYCTRVIIDGTHGILSTHRKLMPTYEERLSWSIGDGAGLVTHPIEDFTLGSLNCWENWMPLARAALYAAGENLHVALWPGGDYNTRDITRFIARESRSYVVSSCGLLRPEDIPDHIPHRDRIIDGRTVLLNGGSAIAGPDGEWIHHPTVGEETLITVDMDIRHVYGERQNFDPSGHYARPDVLTLHVDRTRQGVVGEGTEARRHEGT